MHRATVAVVNPADDTPIWLALSEPTVVTYFNVIYIQYVTGHVL